MKSYDFDGGAMEFYPGLTDLAFALAYHYVSEMRKEIDLDPDGEGWKFHASEYQMSGWDYFQDQVDRYCVEFMSDLVKMPLEKQRVLVAWNKYRCGKELQDIKNDIGVILDKPQEMSWDI